MDNIINTMFPSPTKLAPIPVSQHSVEGLPLPSDNFLDRVYNFGKAPTPVLVKNGGHVRCNTSVYDKATGPTGTTLSPSPRNNVNDDPACVKCNKYAERPFKKGQCQMMYSPEQNTWGPVCDSSSNGDWVRGNQFSVSYDHDKIFGGDKYDMSMPRFIKKDPVIVNNSPFYPYPNYDMKYNKDYYTYPYFNNFFKGKPTYKIPNVMLDDYSDANSNIYKGIYENFGCKTDNINKDMTLGFIVFVIILIMVVAYNLKK